MDDCQPTSWPQPRRKWRTAVVVGLLIPATLAGLTFGGMRLAAEWRARQAEAELKEAIAAVGASEPKGWRLNDLEQQRKHVPDDENGSKLVIDACALLPEGWNGDAIIDEIQQLPPPWRLTTDQADGLRRLLAKLAPSLKTARQLQRFVAGRFPPMRLARDHFTLENPHGQSVRDLSWILYYDAIGEVEEGKPRTGWQSALTAIHAGRTVGDEPALMSQMARMVARVVAVRAMERVLGRGMVDASDLAQARDRLAEETQIALLPIGIRGERAAQHDFYSRIAREDPPLDTVIQPGQGDLKDFGAFDRADEEIRRAIIAAEPSARRVNIAASQTYMLRALTQALNCATQPAADSDECLSEWDWKIKEDKGLNRTPLLASILTPGLWSWRLYEKRNTTLLQCAIVALAAEQFRLHKLRWCKHLSELVDSGLLPRAPADPFDGEPLRLRHTADGLVVYSIGSDKQYTGNAWDESKLLPLSRALESPRDLEFRLWNPDRRGQKPVPRVPRQKKG